MKKQTYAVPEGCKITSVDFETNTVVYESVEQKKYVPKVGDCVKVVTGLGKTSFVICKKFDDKGLLPIFGNFIGKDNTVLFQNSAINFPYTPNHTFEKITTEQFQAEFEKLGYIYDFSTHTSSKLKWMPKYGEKYHYVDADGNTCLSEWKSDIYDNKRIKINNVHKTIADAEKFTQYMKDYDQTK